MFYETAPPQEANVDNPAQVKCSSEKDETPPFPVLRNSSTSVAMD